MKIIVGLGNPGKRYEATKHNIGYMVLDKLARISRIAIKDRGEGYLSGLAKVDGTELILAKPVTYMNRSGAAVIRLLADFKGSPSDLMVIHDDMDMALGRIRIKTRGGHGGHRGVSSIIDNIGTDRFVRIKVGIGRAGDADPADFVLGEFEREELPKMEDAIKRAADAALFMVSNEIKEAMNRYNR